MSLKNKKRIICLGDPVVDYCFFIPDSFLEKHNIPKGGTPGCSNEFIEELLKEFKAEFQDFGGSSANVAKGMGLLGLGVGLSGQCGDDENGQIIINGCKKYNIEDHLSVKKGGISTKIIVCVHPDSQRTMFGMFGASHEPREKKVNFDEFNDYEALLLEGYHLTNPICRGIVFDSIDWAVKEKKKIIMVLSDMFWFKGYKEDLKLVTDKASIITGTEEEFMKLFDKNSRNELLRFLEQSNLELAGVTMGKEGAYLVSKGKSIFIPIKEGIQAVDTVGAGDYFTAGLLYGYFEGYSLELAGKIGAILAGDIVSKLGNNPDPKVKNEIYKLLGK